MNCPRLEKVVGEWTKVPDREIAQLEEEAARKGLPVKVSPACWSLVEPCPGEECRALQGVPE